MKTNSKTIGWLALAAVFVAAGIAYACDKKEASSGLSACAEVNSCSASIPRSLDNGNTWVCDPQNEVNMFPSSCNTTTNLTNCNEPLANCNRPANCVYQSGACVTSPSTANWTQKKTKQTVACTGG